MSVSRFVYHGGGNDGVEQLAIPTKYSFNYFFSLNFIFIIYLRFILFFFFSSFFLWRGNRISQQTCHIKLPLLLIMRYVHVQNLSSLFFSWNTHTQTNLHSKCAIVFERVNNEREKENRTENMADSELPANYIMSCVW